ncbi:MAG: choice-of-anchor tandem repeat GloVer-containing protein [Candidatus Cybelea sp.]
MKREKQISFAASRFDRFARSKKGAAFLSAQVRISDFSRYAVGFFVTAAMLAGCGGSQPPVAAPPPAYAGSSHFSQPGSTNGYQLLYAFRGNRNSNLGGDLPYSSLIAVKNRLYGTTIKGGNLNYSACGRGKFFAGCGTVFEVSASGKERVLYRFAGGSDGFFPYAGLLALNGTLYGTTSDGGGVPCKRHGSCGTVFSLSLSGQERVLHRFSGSPDGAVPSTNLIAVNGALYGTTSNGGSLRGGCARNHGCGVIFAVSPSGSERVIYTFKGSKGGAYPSGPLLVTHGMLYGMTRNGGSGRCGTVFKVSTSGKESIVHSFTVSRGACYPTGGLAAIDGVLYGLTAYGGGSACACGAVFKMTTTGAAKVIYGFEGGSDGSAPLAGLIAFNGALYGTTPEGGGGCSASRGCGTVFRVTTTGVEEVLYAFKGGSDGALPAAALSTLGGVLYGTTSGGGGDSCGYASSESCGTVFKISP